MKETVKFALLVILLSFILWGFTNFTKGEGLTSCITLSPVNITVKVGEFVQGTAVAYDEIGNVIPDAKIQWLPTPDMEHCVSVTSDGTITGKIVGTCGVGALTFTNAGKFIIHQTPITVTVVSNIPEPLPSPTSKPCSRLPNGKCRKGCVCL